MLTLYYVERADEWEDSPRPTCDSIPSGRETRRAIRRIGITSHQRLRQMASGLLDTIMIRYNAAHRGAERDVFPVTQPLGLPIIAYTALRWGALLRTSPDVPAAFSVPRAPDWYRFVLQQPAVAVTLSAPQTRAELEENLCVLKAEGPLSNKAYRALAEHGERVRRHAAGFP